MKEERIKKYFNNFIKLGTDCEFPGCEELRRMYLEEMRNFKGGCGACHRMGLAKKYKQIITNRLNRSVIENG